MVRLCGVMQRPLTVLSELETSNEESTDNEARGSGHVSVSLGERVSMCIYVKLAGDEDCCSHFAE